MLTYRQAVERAVTLQLEERQPLPQHYGDGDTLNDVVKTYLEERLVTPGGRSGRR